MKSTVVIICSRARALAAAQPVLSADIYNTVHPRCSRIDSTYSKDGSPKVADIGSHEGMLLAGLNPAHGLLPNIPHPQVQCRIFHTTFNPDGLRMGNKVLRQRLRGPAMAAYYPRRVATFKDLKNLYPEYETYDDDEEDRLEGIAMYVQMMGRQMAGVRLGRDILTMWVTVQRVVARVRQRRRRPLRVRIVLRAKRARQT